MQLVHLRKFVKFSVMERIYLKIDTYAAGGLKDVCEI